MEMYKFIQIKIGCSGFIEKWLLTSSVHLGKRCGTVEK